VIDLDEDSVEKLLGLLEAKSLNYIEVIPYDCDEEDEEDDEDDEEDEED
jgi:hypothetical protein